MDEIWQAMEESSYGQALMVKGVARGKAGARLQGLLWAAQMMWLYRFGTLSVAVVAVMERLSDEQVQELIALFGKNATEDEMHTYMEM